MMSATELQRPDRRCEEVESFSPQDVDPEKLIVAFLLHRVAKLSQAALADFMSLAPEVANARTQEEFEEIAETIREILFPEVLIGPVEEGMPGAENADHLVERKTWIGQKIKSLRENAALTQQELADKAGLLQSHISRLENAEHSPSNKTLEKIARALGETVRYFDPTEA